jgi:hypothetical protein
MRQDRYGQREIGPTMRDRHGERVTRAEGDGFVSASPGPRIPASILQVRSLGMDRGGIIM